jgi:hypothetical protein
MIPGSMIAMGSYARWDVSDVGNGIVFLFGLLLWVICLFNLLVLGIRAMSSSRHERAKQKRGNCKRSIRRE